MPELPKELIDLANRLKVNPEHLTLSKPAELTTAQRAGLLNVDIHQLSLPIILTPIRPRTGQNYLTFHNSLWVSSSPYTFSPSTGHAVFNTEVAADAYAEIGFVPITANKPHLIEITVDLLNFDKGPKNCQFHTKMLTGVNPIPEKDFSFTGDQSPITLVFPAQTHGLADDYRVVQLNQKNYSVGGGLWAFYSVKITSVL